MLGKLVHFLHLEFLGLGDKHLPYTLNTQDGAFLNLLRGNGEEEMNSDVLRTFYQYYDSVPKPIADGSYKLDYDVAGDTFHGLGTRAHHRKIRFVWGGDEYSLYDLEDKLLDEYEECALYDDMDLVLDTMDYNQLPVGGEGLLLDYDTDTQGFRGFGGGDSGGGGATDDLDRKPDISEQILMALGEQDSIANIGDGTTQQVGDGQDGSGQDNGVGSQDDAVGEGEDETVVTTVEEPETVAPVESEPESVPLAEPEPQSDPEPTPDPEPSSPESAE